MSIQDNTPCGAQRKGRDRCSSQQRLRQHRLELVAQGSGLLFRLVELGQQFLRIAVIVGDGVRVLEVEVVAARVHLLGGDAPRDFILSPALAFRAAPPISAGLQVFYPNGLGHRVGLLALRDVVLVEPDVFRRLALLEEQ